MIALLLRFLPHILGVVAVIGAGVFAYQFIDNRWATDAGITEGSRRVQLLWDEAKTQQREEEIERGRKASMELEVDREKSRTVTRTITKYIDRVVDRPVYRNVCIDDDGLRYLNCAIRGEAGTAACRPDDAVPPATGINR